RETLSWTVVCLALDNPGDLIDFAGDSVSLSFDVAAVASATLSCSASGLPSGLTVHSSTGLIDGTLAVPGAASASSSVTLSVSDGTYSVSQVFGWSVVVLELDGLGNESNVAGDTVSLAMTASDAGSAALTWSASGLPSGVSLNSTGLLSGTVAAPGSLSATYT